MTAPDTAADLLDLARGDLAAARALENVRDSSVATGFHAQQAVEKALKSAIAVTGSDFPFTHDITLLVDLCGDQGLELTASLHESDRLTPYAVAIRHGLADPASVTAAEALGWAALAIEWVETQVRPCASN